MGGRRTQVSPPPPTFAEFYGRCGATQSLRIKQEVVAKADAILEAAAAVKNAVAELGAVCQTTMAAASALRTQEETGALMTAAKSGRANNTQLAELPSRILHLQGCINTVQQQQALSKPALDAAVQSMAKLQDVDLNHLMAATLTPPMSVHNNANSRLLSLPENVLTSIAHRAGKAIRSVCVQLHLAYGCPGTNLTWPTQSSSDPRFDWDNDTTLQPAFLNIISTWNWPGRLTQLQFSSSDPLQSDVFFAIATQLPNLRSLSIPWLAQPFAAGQLPPQLTALTSLAFVQEDRTLYTRPPRQLDSMRAFSQLPQLMPKLNTLSLWFGPAVAGDAFLTSAMQQLNGRLTSLTLDRHVFLGDSKSTEEDNPVLLASLVAVSSSLAHLTLHEPHMFRMGLRSTLLLLTCLTSLAITGSMRSPALTNVPHCNELPALLKLDLSEACHDSANYRGMDSFLAVLPTWLAAGCAGSGVRELLLPPVVGGQLSLAPSPFWPVLASLGACPGFTRLTSLDVNALANRNSFDRTPGGWPAALCSLGQLQRLSVKMETTELPSTRGWGRALTALTYLRLALPHTSMRPCADQALLDETLRSGVGELVGVRHLQLDLDMVWSDEQTLRAGQLLRAAVLKAGAGMPQLEVLGLAKGIQLYGGDGLSREELGALDYGPAGSSLRRLVLDKEFADEEWVTMVGLVLPGVNIEWVRGWVSECLQRKALADQREAVADAEWAALAATADEDEDEDEDSGLYGYGCW